MTKMKMPSSIQIPMSDSLPGQRRNRRREGEARRLNRIARLTMLAGIMVQIGYERAPGSYGDKPPLGSGPIDWLTAM